MITCIRSGFEFPQSQLGFKPLSGCHQLLTLHSRATLICASFGGLIIYYHFHLASYNFNIEVFLVDSPQLHFYIGIPCGLAFFVIVTVVALVLRKLHLRHKLCPRSKAAITQRKEGDPREVVPLTALHLVDNPSYQTSQSSTCKTSTSCKFFYDVDVYVCLHVCLYAFTCECVCPLLTTRLFVCIITYISVLVYLFVCIFKHVDKYLITQVQKTMLLRVSLYVFVYSYIVHLCTYDLFCKKG